MFRVFVLRSICCLLLLSAAACDRRSVSIEAVEPYQNHYQGISYYLPKGVVTLTISYKPPKQDDNEVALTLTVGEVAYIPDLDKHYQVNINHDVFYADTITVETDGNGLLKAVNSITEDKTPDIIKKIANAPVEILGGEERGARLAEIRPYSLTYQLDPTSPGERAKLNAIISRLNPRVYFHAEPFGYNTQGIDGGYGTDCLPTDVCFRPPIPYALELRGIEDTVISRAIVVVPNKNVVGRVAVTRAPFVKRDLQLAFTNGMLTKSHLDNPSEVLAAVQIPIDVAKAIVAIPSALFNFQVKQVQADNQMLEAQKQNLSLQREIIKANQELAKLQVEASEATQ